MDQHPIPQDVTGFQFKLIGTMTVKQFGYVASGVVAAVILYYLPLNSALGILFKVFMVPLFGISGVIIAFVPLDGRPIDVMATNFVKALFSPNQYIYHRQGRKLSFTTVAMAKAPATQKTAGQKIQSKAHTQAERLDEKEEKLRTLLLSSHGEGKSELDKKEAAFLTALTSQPQTPAHPLPVNTPKPASPVQMSSQPTPPPQEIKDDSTPAPHAATEHKMTVLTKQIEEAHVQKQQLEQELSHLKTQLATQKGIPAPSLQPKQPVQPLQDPQHVRTIPQAVTKTVGLPHVSDSPNVVVGIVKDPRGNILPNILVEVKDKDGNPVRAFKTNQLGQFASATPLSPGTYTIDLDDPKKQHRFDVIQIVANNQVLLPIEIISHDAREELRKQLFAN